MLLQKKFLFVPQKLENSLTGNFMEDTAVFLDLLTQVGGLDTDKRDILEYVNLLQAVTAYRPGRCFTGAALAIKAVDTSLPVSIAVENSWSSFEKVR